MMVLLHTYLRVARTLRVLILPNITPSPRYMATIIGVLHHRQSSQSVLGGIELEGGMKRASSSMT